jgi:hypothetical protein
MEKGLKIGIKIGAVVILIIISSIIYYKNNCYHELNYSSGRVLDIRDNQPITNIIVERIVTTEHPTIQGEGQTKLFHDMFVLTDSSGAFKLDSQKIKHCGNIFQNILINGGQEGDWGEVGKSNEEYYSYNTADYFDMDNALNGGEFKECSDSPCTIHLIPKVNNLTKCEGNQICISRNVLILVEESKDEKLCLMLENKEEILSCVSMAASNELNKSICNILEDEYRNSCIASVDERLNSMSPEEN